MLADHIPDVNETRFSALTDDVTVMQASFIDHAFERHSHDFFSIGITTFGVQSFQCKGKRYDSRVGDLVLFNPDEDHDGRSGTPEGFRYNIWYLTESFVRSCLDADAGTKGQPYFTGSHLTDMSMAAAFVALNDDLMRHPSEALRVESLIRTFLGRMLGRYGERAQAVTAEPLDPGLARLERVKDYIRTYFQQDLTIAELAQVAGLSRAQLIRAFSARFNVSLHAYLNAVRISHAQRLIRLGLPLSAVATDCGFADQSHFSRRFKGSIGTTPASWRSMLSRTA